MSMKRLMTAGTLFGLMALAGCGGSSSSSTTSSSGAPAASTTAAASSASSSAASGSGAGGASTLKLAANPSGQLKFDTSTLSASAGKVTVDFTNSSPLAHNVTIASSSGTVIGATPTFQGGTKTLTVNLKPGTYTFYCSVPGHRQAGMQGTLTVK
jgi:plastocyanin